MYQSFIRTSSDDFRFRCKAFFSSSNFCIFSPLIQSLNTERWWSPRSLERLGVNDDVDPFALPENHPAAKLRWTVRAYKDFIQPPGVSSVDKGIRLSQIWKKCLLRIGQHYSGIRTFDSDELFLLEDVEPECPCRRNETHVGSILRNLFDRIVPPCQVASLASTTPSVKHRSPKLDPSEKHTTLCMN